MRRLVALVAVAALAAVAAGCGGSSSSSTKQTSGAAAAGTTNTCAKSNLKLVHAGSLTVGTDNPAYPPWFGGKAQGKWKVSDPNSGQGFESAVAYAVAGWLGFSRGQVHWTYVPFNKSFAPGPKSFDLDINEISYTPARANVVDFSNSYYDVNQGIVVRKDKPIANAKTVADLEKYKLGAQLGTTSYTYIQNRIKPSHKPAVFPTNDAAVQSLKNGQIDGLVVDLPTAFYVTAVQVPNSKILGQFPSQPGGEHFGMVLKKGSPLTTCINKALAALKAKGQLKRIQDQWLSKATGAPVLH
jgi:polar amino acid transport system substrate-binding protein